MTPVACLVMVRRITRLGTRRATSILMHKANTYLSGEKVTGNLRKFNESELDSGDDETHDDRVADEDQAMEDDVGQQRELKVCETSVGRHPIPCGSDGEVSPKLRL